MSKYKIIIDHLIDGGKVAPKNETGFRGFYLNKEKTLIRYNNHGSSAVRFNIENLKWLVSVIFSNVELELKSKDYFVYY